MSRTYQRRGPYQRSRLYVRYVRNKRDMALNKLTASKGENAEALAETERLNALLERLGETPFHPKEANR